MKKLLCTVFAALFLSTSVQYAADISVYAENTVGATVYYSNDFENGTIGGATDSINAGSGGTISNETVEGNGMLRFYAPEEVKGNAFADVYIPQIAEADKYVIDVRVNPVEISANSHLELFDAKDENGKWRLGGFIKGDHAIYVKNASGGSVKVGTWQENTPFRYSLKYDVSRGVCSVFINGAASSNINIGTLRPTRFRIDIGSPENERLDVYIDNYRFYGGTELLSDDEIAASAPSSVLDNERAAKGAIGNDSVFTCGNYYFVNGEKTRYINEAQRPVVINNEAYVSNEFVKTVLGKTEGISSSESGAVTQNGTLYMPASRLSAYTGEKYYYDKRGFFVLSQNDYQYTDSDDFTKLFETADLVYRYLWFDNPSGEKVYSDYLQSAQNGQHPRILLTAADISYINEKKAYDAVWDNAVNDLLASARVYLAADSLFPSDCPDNKKQDTSVNFQNCMEKLTLAYLLTGDGQYAEAGMRYINSMCGWTDIAYQTSNLTIGHWAMGMAMGYDGFYGYFSQSDEGRACLETMRQASERLIFGDTLSAYQRKGGPRWVTISDNFQGVISGGVLSLAFSMLDEAATDSDRNDLLYIIENVIKSMELAVSLYAPDGGYFEGVSYSDYMLGNLTKGMEALFNCCGSDYSLGSAQGFADAGSFFVYMQTAKNRFNFHDCIPGVTATWIPSWLAYRYGEMSASEMNYLQNEIRKAAPDVLGLLNYSRACDKYGFCDVSDEPLDIYYRNAGTGSFRNSFNTDIPTFAGIHGGRTGLTHDMLDAGEFVFEADGVTWAMDLGSDNYNLPSYFDTNGYKLYRKRPEGENCVVINPDGDYFGQEIGASATLTKFQSGNKAAMAAFDLSEIYKRDVKSYTRGYYFGDDRNTLLVQDEITLKSLTSSEIYWFMHTPANIEIVDRKTAILTYGGKKLRAEVYCSSSGYELVDMPASPLPASPTVSGQNENNGIRKLAVHCPKARSKVTIAVKLIPINDFYTPQKLVMKQIAQWTLPSGDISVTPAVGNARLDTQNNFTATVQMPSDAESAYLYIDGNPICDIPVKRGEKYTIDSVAAPGIMPGEHTVRIKIIYDDKREESIYGSFENEVYESTVFYSNPFNFASSVNPPVRPEGWRLNLYGENLTYSDECMTSRSTSAKNARIDFVVKPNYGAETAVRGNIEMRCDIMFSSIDGKLNIECKNGAQEFYMHDVPIAENGKFANGDAYETGKWYTLKFVLDTDLKTASVYMGDRAVASGVSLPKADSVSLFRLQYVAGGADISFKDYRITKYRKVVSDFGTISFSSREITAGSITASVTGKLKSPSRNAALYVLVVDKENGRAVDVKVKEIEYTESEETFGASVTVPADFEKYEVRAMLWSGGLEPLAGVSRLGL